MSLPIMEKMRVPLLRKIKGDVSIGRVVPIFDAQFLIGKSWDVSFVLNFSEVRERHCTIEKIAADAWTLLSHENATVKINEHVLYPGLCRFLRCGDLLSLSANLVFQFKCSSLSCKKCNEEASHGSEFDPAISSNADASSCSKSNVEPSSNDNSEFVEYRRNLEDSQSPSHALMANVNPSEVTETYRGLPDSMAFEVETVLERCRNSRMKVLTDIVTQQSNFIETLQTKINQFYHEVQSGKDRTNYLEGVNQHLNNENVTLRAKIAQYIESAETLRNENSDLQAEVVRLKAKQKRLMLVIECQSKEDTSSCSSDSSQKTINEVNRSCEAVMEIESKLTKLLETEFKCTICDEVFVEAMVTNCGHTFCELCLSTWKVIRPTCPICRSNLYNETKALAVDSYLNNIMPFASQELRSSWLKTTEERRDARSKSQKRKYFSDPLVTINIEYAGFALHQFYERLFRNEFDRVDETVVDLTTD